MPEIPKIIHQIWIGPKTSPTKLMDSWKVKHSGFEYIRWSEEELLKRGFESNLKSRIDSMEEINGKADILRWEILYEYGGVFVDADSICIEPLDYLVNKYEAFAGYENEQVRNKGWAKKSYDDVLARTHPLIATGVMAFPPKHELPKMAIEWIKNNEISIQNTGLRAWRTVGPGLITRLFFSKEWKDITILPSYYFFPIHCTGVEYKGHAKIYAYQEWCNTRNSYDTVNDISLPEQFHTPIDSISIVIRSLNTQTAKIAECLDAIKEQTAHVFFEITWINYGRDPKSTSILKQSLKEFKENARFTEIIYKETENNQEGLRDSKIVVEVDGNNIMNYGGIFKRFKSIKEKIDIAVASYQGRALVH